MSEEAKNKSGKPPVPPAKGEHGAENYAGGNYGAGESKKPSGEKSGAGEYGAGGYGAGGPSAAGYGAGGPSADGYGAGGYNAAGYGAGGYGVKSGPQGMPQMGFQPGMMGIPVVMVPVMAFPGMYPQGPQGMPPKPQGMPGVPPMGRPDGGTEEKMIEKDKERLLEFLSLIDEILRFRAAKILGIPKPIFIKIVEELEKEEKVSLKPSPENEEKKLIFITEKGKVAVEEKKKQPPKGNQYR